MLKEKYKNIILEICSKHIQKPYELYLFGSRARNDDAYYSDIDLAIQTNDQEKKDYKLALIREDFEESIIPYQIDFMDLDKVSNDMKSSILKDGVLLQ